MYASQSPLLPYKHPEYFTQWPICGFIPLRALLFSHKTQLDGGAGILSPALVKVSQLR